MKNKFDTQAYAKLTGIRTFQLVQYTTGLLEGEIENWPNNIKDAIYQALEAASEKFELPLTVVYSRADFDVAEEVGQQDRPYVHVIASEIVVADTRYTKVRDEVKSIIADAIAGRKTLH